MTSQDLVICLIVIVIAIPIVFWTETIKSLKNQVDDLQAHVKRLNSCSMLEEGGSLTTIYDENGGIGSEWTFLVDPSTGHWVTAIYDERTGKFKTKHFYTTKIGKELTYQQRREREKQHDDRFVYGSAKDQTKPSFEKDSMVFNFYNNS